MKKLALQFALLSSLATQALAQPASHPLDPLSQSEMDVMVKILTDAGKLNSSSRFPIVTLQEPGKEEVRGFQAQAPFKRQAFAVILDHSQGRVFETVVDLTAGKVASWKDLPGKHPGVLVEEFEYPAKIVRQHPGWQEAMKKRGITDFANVQIDTWGAGILSPEDHRSGNRLLRMISFYRVQGGKNPYCRPIEGVITVFDPKERKVVRIEDTGVIAPVHKGWEGELDGETISKQLGGLRPALKPIVYSQPEGSSIIRRGNEVTWDRWKFHFAMHPREGLLLQNLSYNDKGNWRPVLYRGSLSEMVVPYGDTAANWSWRNAFDLGEYGVGRLANTLRPGFEVPRHAVLVDSVFANDLGKAYILPNSVALYERDAGILWKHLDFDTQVDQTRPARNLHLTYVATVGNYDYALSWILGQDGSVGVNAQLTGIVLAKGVPSTTSQGLDAQGEERYGRLVGKNIVAPNHQHFFNFRLDLDVDGPANSLVETNNKAMPAGPDNPMLNAFSRIVTPLRSEKEAQRDMNMHSQRTWMVVNPNVKNGLGQNTAYQLMHGENSIPYMHPEAPVFKRAGFIRHHLWGTRYRDSELYASGDYPNQSTVSTGLPGYSQNDESLENQDLVLWYTCGVTHNPRPEEWPVMPSHNTGFKLIPNGFFSQNPALDVPPPAEVKP